MASTEKRRWRHVLRLIAVSAAIALVGALSLYLLARLIFAPKIIHSSDVAVVEGKLKLKLGQVERVEGYFVHGFRVWLCWARFETQRGAFQSLLGANGIEGGIQAPWEDSERVQRHYGNPGVEGHQPADWNNWVAKDFVPEGEYRRFNSEMIFGYRKEQPERVLAYVYGCPRDSNVVMPGDRSNTARAGRSGRIDQR